MRAAAWPGRRVRLVTWLDDLPPGDTDWARVVALQPDLMRSLVELQRITWTLVDPVVLELSRIRIATLIGAPTDQQLRSEAAIEAGLQDDKIAALDAWATSPLFSAGERACIDLAEQFVIDVQGVTDQHVQAVTEHLGASQCYVFVNALWSMEALQRMCLVLGVEPVPQTIGSR
jgi:alkylhydroperoxidase family enzyme